MTERGGNERARRTVRWRGARDARGEGGVLVKVAIWSQTKSTCASTRPEKTTISSAPCGTTPLPFRPLVAPPPPRPSSYRPLHTPPTPTPRLPNASRLPPSPAPPSPPPPAPLLGGRYPLGPAHASRPRARASRLAPPLAAAAAAASRRRRAASASRRAPPGRRRRR